MRSLKPPTRWETRIPNFFRMRADGSVDTVDILYCKGFFRGTPMYIIFFGKAMNSSLSFGAKSRRPNRRHTTTTILDSIIYLRYSYFYSRIDYVR